MPGSPRCGSRAAPPGRWPVPVSIDLSAEATSFRGVPLRRLRGAFFLEGERLTLSDVSALLPGDLAVEVAGATAGPRMELAVRFAGQNLRATLAALGLPLTGTDPARLRAAEGRFGLVLQDSQVAISDLVATIDGTRLSGAGVVRQGPRPAIGLGLTLDRLDLDGLVPDELARGLPDTAGIAAWLGGFDLNLRLAAEELTWRDLRAERATLDATLENGRLALRRLALRVGEVDIAASGTAMVGGPVRVPEFTVQVSGAQGAALVPLLPEAWAGLGPLLAQPVAMRISGGGLPEAVALKAEGDLGELRVEAAATINATSGRGTGTLTLRHPGAPRLLAPLLGPDAAVWLGEGSFSLIATLASAEGRTLTAERFDLVAGTLRLRSRLTLAPGVARPRLTGQVHAERLPLPGPALGATPLGLDRLAAVDAELAVEAARVEPLGWPVLENLTGRLRLDAGGLRLEGVAAQLAGGALRAELVVDGAATPPRLALEAQITDAAISDPLFGLPFDLGAGQVHAQAKLAATGHSVAALAATLEGTLDLAVQDGVLVGLDLAALQAAAALPDLGEAEPAMLRALEDGATAFDRLEAAGVVDEGRLRLREARVVLETGGVVTIGGDIDLGRTTLDLRLGTRPVPDAPEIGLRLTGPLAAPRRLPELAPFLRWRAER